MSILIGAARIDERGKDYGGQAGDQTGHEVEAYLWTDRGEDGWNVLRYRDKALRGRAVEMMWQIIQNPHIGYSQTKHGSLEKAAKEVDWRFDRITRDVDTDCCDLQRTIAHALGVDVGSCYTATQVNVFMATGAFEIITGPKVAHTDNYLLAGDIGCMPPGVKGHTWMALENGPMAQNDTEMLYVVTSYGLNERTGPGTKYPIIQALHRDDAFNVTSYAKAEDGGEWAYGEAKGRFGFCSMRYLVPAVQLPTLTTFRQSWLREGVGTKAKKICVIPAQQTFSGTGITEIAADGRLWYEAIYNGLRGWISSRYLTVS